MNFIPVKLPGFHYRSQIGILANFSDYLVSIANTTTSKSWNLYTVDRDVGNILKDHVNIPEFKDSKIFLDSGGYQMVVGYIQNNRFNEYIQVYHFILEKYRNDYDFIFSLDVNKPGAFNEGMKEYNDSSIDMSISSMKKYPIIREKQIFIIQAITPEVLLDWYNLMEDHDIVNEYKHFSFGGLTGAKTSTPFIPMMFWLDKYTEVRGNPIKDTNKRLHLLGQGAPLAMITAAIIENMIGINVTMDASSIHRFSKIEAQLPVLYQNSEDFEVIKDVEDVEKFIVDSIHPRHQIDFDIELSGTMIEIKSQYYASMMSFANDIATVPDILNYTEERLQRYHPIFTHGTLAKRLVRNLKKINFFKTLNFEEIHTLMTSPDFDEQFKKIGQ